MPSNVEKNVDMQTLENLLRKSEFINDTFINGLKGFSYINTWEELGLTTSEEKHPQYIFDRAPEHCIISLDTPNNGNFPEASTGHFWCITSDYTYSKLRPTPIFCLWNNGSNSVTYFNVYNNIGDTFIWHKLNRSKTNITNVAMDGEPGTVFSYRVINEQFVEWWASVDTVHDVLTIATTLPSNLIQSPSTIPDISTLEFVCICFDTFLDLPV